MDIEQQLSKSLDNSITAQIVFMRGCRKFSLWIYIRLLDLDLDFEFVIAFVF